MNLMLLAWIFWGIAVVGIIILIYNMKKSKRSNYGEYIEFDYIDELGRPVKVDNKNGYYIVATTGEIIFEFSDSDIK